MRAVDFIETNLMEVSMRPSALRQMAADIDAKAGMEFEMAVPGITVRDEPEGEPDYDRDVSIRSLDQIARFFNRLQRPEQQHAVQKMMSALTTDYEWWSEKHDPDDYFKSQGYYTMLDLPFDTWDVSWPHIRRDDSRDSDAELRELTTQFSRALGKPANFSKKYHGAKRDTTNYIIEVDSSIEANANDAGLEFISPPLSIAEMLFDFGKVISWAKRRGCYTNESTGLHMNVSVPNFSVEKLDYIKLALLMGDEYVLEQYGRAANAYCRSSLGIVQNQIGMRPDATAKVIEKMKAGLSQIATKAIHNGITDKYVSINTKQGYIEFRSPGGDWLNIDFQKMENTLLRFVVALDAACDPNKFRQDYLKKLYALLNPSGQLDLYGDMISEFSKYVTAVGGASAEAVKNFRSAALQQLRQSKMNKAGKGMEQKYWWFAQHPSQSESISVVATNPDGAKKEALMKWGLPLNPRELAATKVSMAMPYKERS